MHQHSLTPVGPAHMAPAPGPIPMPTCPNCGTVISCGCQRVVASDGAEVCDECADGYENALPKR